MITTSHSKLAGLIHLVPDILPENEKEIITVSKNTTYISKHKTFINSNSQTKPILKYCIILILCVITSFPF